MLNAAATGDRLGSIYPVANVAQVRHAIHAIEQVYVAPVITDYIVRLVAATRANPELRLGASPRACVHLMRAARVSAALSHRDYVVPEDVSDLAVPVLAHRVLLTVDAQVARRDNESIIATIAASTPRPHRS